jgi:hypothetical protein
MENVHNKLHSMIVAKDNDPVGINIIPKENQSASAGVASREDLRYLSKTDPALAPLLALRDRDTFPCPEWINGIKGGDSVIKWEIIDRKPAKFYQPGPLIREAFADLLTGSKTFSAKLINSIAAEEQSGRQGRNDSDLFEGTQMKADGGPEHIGFVFERLLDLQSCLLEEFGGNRFVRDKIEAAIPSERIDEVEVRIDGPGAWRRFFPDSVKPNPELRPVIEKLRTYLPHHIPVPEGLSVRESLTDSKLNDQREFYKGYEPGLTLRRTFAGLIGGKETFSSELINSIAEEEKSGSAGHNDSDVFEAAGINADGGPEHIDFILERLLDLQSCLRAEFKEDKPAFTKIEAAITNEQLGNVKKALNV